MGYLFVVIVVLTVCVCVFGESSTLPPTSLKPYPMHKTQASPTEYVPHRTYLDAGVRSDGYGYPVYETYPPHSPINYGPIQTILNAIYKLGYVVLGGAALFFVGAIFITAICNFTSLCTITFAPLENIDKDAMVRAFMTPEKLATAAALVQDAVGKYQRLQKMKNE